MSQGGNHRTLTCSRCLEIGYHSPIHECPWITHCPLHLNEAIREITPETAGMIPRSRARLWLAAVAKMPPGQLSLGVARRGPFPIEASQLIEGYLAAVKASKAFPSSTVLSWERPAGEGLARLRDPALTSSSVPVHLEADLCVAVTHVLSERGHRQLLGTIARTALPPVTTIRVPFTSASTLPVAVSNTGLDSCHPFASERRRIVEFVPGGQQMYRPCHPATAQPVRDLFERLAKRIMRSLESVNPCQRATDVMRPDFVAGAFGQACAICEGLAAWTMHVHGDGRFRYHIGEIGARCYGSSPYAREIDLPDTPQRRRMLKVMLTLDSLELFLGVLEIRALLCRLIGISDAVAQQHKKLCRNNSVAL